MAKTFRELEVWKLGFKAAQEIFRFTKEFPKEERYSLTDQIRRASRAVTAMIAEAWGRRRYRAVFVNKLDEAMGEANETQSWLAQEYITAADFKALDAEYQRIGGKTEPHDRPRRRLLQIRPRYRLPSSHTPPYVTMNPRIEGRPARQYHSQFTSHQSQK